jgi:hypothetical protein
MQLQTARRRADCEERYPWMRSVPIRRDCNRTVLGRLFVMTCNGWIRLFAEPGRNHSRLRRLAACAASLGEQERTNVAAASGVIAFEHSGKTDCLQEKRIRL